MYSVYVCFSFVPKVGIIVYSYLSPVLRYFFCFSRNVLLFPSLDITSGIFIRKICKVLDFTIFYDVRVLLVTIFGIYFDNCLS